MCVCVYAGVFLSSYFCMREPDTSHSAHGVYEHLDLLYCLSLRKIWHLQSLSATLANYRFSLSGCCSEKRNCRQRIKKCRRQSPSSKLVGFDGRL